MRIFSPPKISKLLEKTSSSLEFSYMDNFQENSIYIKLIGTIFNSRFKSEEFVNKAQSVLLTSTPELVSEGEGGTYFLRDDETDEVVAVFKPRDEEPFSPTNPKYKENSESNNLTIKKGIKSGEAAIREVAAFLLDKNFSGVPLTVLVELSHPMFPNRKIGSLQEYVVHDCGSWDLGFKKYSAHDVHRIGILDIRMLNVDRHGGNMLAAKVPGSPSYKLIPIDHGFSLPDSLDGSDLWFEWISWPQAKVPFDKECLDFIANINVEADANLLRSLFIREECIRTMMITTTLLKKAAERGMTLYEIANLMCRKKYVKKKEIRY